MSHKSRYLILYYVYTILFLFYLATVWIFTAISMAISGPKTKRSVQCVKASSIFNNPLKIDYNKQNKQTKKDCNV